MSHVRALLRFFVFVVPPLASDVSWQWRRKKVGNEISFRYSGDYHKFSKTKIKWDPTDAVATKLNQIMEVYWLLRSIHELPAAQIRDVVCTDAAPRRSDHSRRGWGSCWTCSVYRGPRWMSTIRHTWSMQATLRTIRDIWIIDGIFLH